MKNYFLKLDGEIVDMQAGQSVTLERYSPLFDFDVIRGGKVLDFGLPFSQKNDALFNWFGLHQSRYEGKKYYCEKYAEGILFEKGFVELLDVTDAGYQVFFSQNLGDFFGDYQTTPLDLIDFGNENVNLKVDFDYLVDKVAFPSIKNKAFFGDNVKSGFTGIVNEVVGGSFTAGSPKVPFVSLKYIFERIGTLCNISFSGEFFESEWFRRGLIDNTFALDDATVIRFQNHLPKLTIPEFLKELGKLLNVAIYIDSINRVVQMRFREDRMKQATGMNLTSKVQPSRGRKPERATRLELDWELDGGDNLMKVVPSDFLKYQGVGDSDVFFSLKTKFSTRLKDEASGLAICEQVGISKEFNQQGNSFSAKLLLWNGVVGGVPVATNEWGGYRLAWHGANNLVASSWSYYEAWRRTTATRTVFARLSAADLAALDYHVSGGENSVVHIQGRDYYVDNIRINLPITGYATMELWDK